MPELEKLVVGVDRERVRTADAVDVEAACRGDRLHRRFELLVVEDFDRIAQGLRVGLKDFALDRGERITGLDRGIDLGRRLDEIARQHDLKFLVTLIANLLA
jgi:hypothetical protein